MMIMCINVLMPVGSYFLHQSLCPVSGVREALKICSLNLHNIASCSINGGVQLSFNAVYFSAWI